MMDGFYANKVISHDAFNKTITETDFSYKNNYNKNYHLETTGESIDDLKMITPDTQLNDTGKGICDYPDSYRAVVPETSKIHNDYEFTSLSDHLGKQISQEIGYDNMNMALLVYGNTSLNAGDVINFSSPLLQPGDVMIPQPYTAGRYLIMAIKHTISIETQSHEMVVRCFKDSVRTPYPVESDPLIVGNETTDRIDIYKEDIASL